MRRIFLLLMLASSIAFSAIDECKTDVYFGNGILTEIDDAQHNAEKVLAPAIIEKFGLDYFNKKIGKVDYAYNRTVNQGWDLFESTYQVINLQNIVDIGANWLMKNKETIHSLDLDTQVQKHNSSINQGHNVLVVAHSQGNLYAQEAYEKIDDDLKKHWEAVSIASPDPITDIKPDMPPRIGWDNDMVAIVGGSDNTPCNVRQIEWEIKPHLMGEQHPLKPDDNYVYENQVDTHYQGWWKAKEGLVQKYLESNVHSFRFYMGGNLREGDKNKPNFGHVYINPFDNKPLQDTSAKSLIMDQIDWQLKKLESLCSANNNDSTDNSTGDNTDTNTSEDTNTDNDSTDNTDSNDNTTDTGDSDTADPSSFDYKSICTGIDLPDPIPPELEESINEAISGASDLVADIVCPLIDGAITAYNLANGGGVPGGL